VGSHLESDEMGRLLSDGAVVPRVWAAGNATNLMAQVVVSAAAGLGAATAINADLILEEVAAAVAEYRQPFSAGAEARNTTVVLGDRRHGIVPTPNTLHERSPH